MTSSGGFAIVRACRIPLIPQQVAQVAQLVEQRTENPRVGGSIPSLGTTILFSVDSRKGRRAPRPAAFFFAAPGATEAPRTDNSRCRSASGPPKNIPTNVEERNEDPIPSDDRRKVAQHLCRTAGFVVFDYDGESLASDYRPIASAPAASCCGGEDASRHVTI